MPPVAIPSRSRAVGAARALALCSSVALSACGEGRESTPPGGPAPAAVRWNVSPAKPDEQARFALARLVTGALPQEALFLPDQHAQMLRLAKNDLTALPAETAALLADESLIRRVTGPDATDLNPWHSLLEVLSALPTPDLDLVRRWIEPVLTRQVPALTLRAVGCLAATRSSASGPLTLRFLEHGADDRHVSREALKLLARLPEPWPARALAVTYAHGSPFAWEEAAAALEQGRDNGAREQRQADVLAWWSLLAEQAGPRPPTGTPRVKTRPFTEWSAGESAARAADGRPRAQSARELDGRGWLSSDLVGAAELPLLAVLATGTEPAAAARCALAVAGRLPATRAVERDRASGSKLLSTKAVHCMLPGESGVSEAELLADTEAFLARLEDPQAKPLDLSAVAQAQRRLPPAKSPAAVALLTRVLREARPVPDLLLYHAAAHDALQAAGEGHDQAAVRALLASPEGEDRGLGMHLAQRARDPAYMRDLERLEADVSPEGRAAIRQALQWIATGGGLAPEGQVAFSRRYARWVDEAPDAQAAGLLPGLLDLGEPGQQALIERLHGPRRGFYVQALRDLPGVLPRAVAERLADLLDRTLPAAERHDLLVTLWRTAPAESVGAVAAAKSRLEPADRPAVDVVLDVVRHRAAH